MLSLQREHQDNKRTNNMADWRNFYIRKMGTGNLTKESVLDFGIWCKAIPFKLMDKVKQPPSRSWNDQHGVDEFIPAGGLFIDAYTMKVEFGCKKMSAMHDGSTTIPAVTDVRSNVATFINFLRTSGMMMLYSSYTGIGRQNVRLESINDNAKWKNQDGELWLIFEVVFKVCDPITDITASDMGITGSSSSSSD